MNFGTDEIPNINDKFYKLMNFSDVTDEREPIVTLPSPTFDTVYNIPSSNYFENIINSTRSLNEIPKHAFSFREISAVPNYNDFVTSSKIPTKENLFGECNPYIEFPREESVIPEAKYEMPKTVKIDDPNYIHLEDATGDKVYDIKEIIDKNDGNVVIIPLAPPREKTKTEESQMIVYKKTTVSDFLLKDVDLEQIIDIKGFFRKMWEIQV